MSQSKIYVGNLSYNTTEDELRDFFANHGEISDVKLIIDLATGRSKGFGFITYNDAKHAESALELNGADLDGRKLKVNIAENRRPGGPGQRPAGGRDGFKKPFNRSFNNRSEGGRQDRFERNDFNRE